jgi:hypothetical protein
MKRRSGEEAGFSMPLQMGRIGEKATQICNDWFFVQ